MNAVSKFEGAIAEYLKVRPEDIVCCNNGTSALIATLKGFDIQDTYVATSPFSFPATTNSILLTNNIPVFYDIERDGLLDFERIYTSDEDIIFKNPEWTPKYILYPTLFDIIRVPDRSRFTNVIVDGAQSFSPSELWNEVDAVTFSFYKTKKLSTYEGGAILCKNKEVNKKIRSIINQGQTSPWQFDELGYNFRMPEVIAEIGYLNLTTSRFGKTKTMRDGYYPFLIPDLPYMQKQPYICQDDLTVARNIVQALKGLYG